MKPFRIEMNIECNTPDKEIKINVRRSQKYPRVQWNIDRPFSLLPVALVGGGHSVEASLDILRKWEGDIYAVNDTAGYLSDNGISCYVFSIDGSRVPYRTGKLVKGALFASMVHRKQFVYDFIRVFDMAEHSPYGVTGGPTAMCRAPMTFLRMGHSQIHYFGCDGSTPDINKTHVSGIQKVAQENMIIIRAGGIDYLSNSSWVMQSTYLAGVIDKYPSMLINRSGGLLSAMVEHKDTWEMAAISEDLKDQIERKNKMPLFKKQYSPEDKKIWQPQAT